MAKVYTEVLSGGQSYPVWDKAAHADITNLSGNFTAHSANNDMHTTTAEKAEWNAKLGPDALNNYYTKNETSGAEQISGALDALDQQFSAYIDSVAAAIEAGSAAGDWVNANGDTVLQAVTDVGTVSSDLESLYSTVTAHTADDAIHVTTSDKDRWDSYEGAYTVLSGALDGLETAVSDIQDRLTPVENDLSSLQSDVSNLQSSVDSLESNVESLQSEVSTLQTDVSTLQDTVDGVQTDVSNLQSDVENLQSDVSTLQDTVDGVQTDVSNLQSDVENLQSDVSTLNERVDDVESALGDKADQSSLDEVVYNVETITGDLESLTATVNDHIADDDVHVTTADKDKWNSYDGAVSVLSGAIDEQDDVISNLSDRVDTVETNLGNKADKTELDSYVLNSAFEEYKTSVAGDIASGVAASAWIENYQPSSPLTAGDFISIEDDVISVSGLDTLISGTDGISAKWDTAASGWNITLDKEEIAYARYTTNSVAAADEAANVTVTGLQEAELYGDKITSNTDSITLQPGLYHADVKLMLQVTTPSPKYEAVKLAAGFSPARSTEIDLDCSYVHNESVCLSFDAMVSEEADVDLSIENLPAGVGYTLSYFNIHEIVNVAGLLTNSQTAIVAGDGLSKDGNELAVKLGGGLKFDNNKNITIAVGNGLKISDAALATDIKLELDDIAGDTVKEVEQISNDLDEKVTTAYPYACITGSSDMTTQGDAPSNGSLIRHLFTVPIKSKIYVRGVNAETAKKVTTVTVYMAKNSYNQSKVILGIYEYQPDYVKKDESGAVIQRGRTVALCDTGPVTLDKGLNEFEMIHFNNNPGETELELKSSRMYYASVYVSRKPGSGLFLATCPGYPEDFHGIPTLTCIAENVEIDISSDDKKDTSFNEMGWGTNAYKEYASCPRVFMQFRNKKIDV